MSAKPDSEAVRLPGLAGMYAESPGPERCRPDNCAATVVGRRPRGLHERLKPRQARYGRRPSRAVAELKKSIHLQVIGTLGPQIFNMTLDPEELRQRVLTEIRQLLSAETVISRDDRERLTAEIADDILGYGPLERLLTDDSITEIMVNGQSEV